VRRSTLEEQAIDPVGGYVAGDSWISFCASPRLWGVILWGRPDETAAFALGRALVLELGATVAPHFSIIDCSRIEGGDPRSFRAAGRYIAMNQAALERQVQRLALVRPAGMDGALVAGAYDVLPRPYPVEVFGDATTAATWLDPELDAVATAQLLVDMHAAVIGTPKEVGALRALLDHKLDGIPIAKAAKQLGLSERTLQRKLAEAGTTFKDELADARIRAAKRMLLESAAPLTTIAFDVGCGSLQYFSALFRRRTGESPSGFRAKRRS
jgi:AraC-like DNA-binding protein